MIERRSQAALSGSSLESSGPHYRSGSSHGLHATGSDWKLPFQGRRALRSETEGHVTSDPARIPVGPKRLKKGREHARQLRRRAAYRCGAPVTSDASGRQ